MQPVNTKIFFPEALTADPCTDSHNSFTPTWSLSVLYVFAGKERQADVRSHLEDLQQQFNFLLTIKEVDIVRDPALDVTDKKLIDSLLLEIDSRVFDVIIVTPPCNTFSRARSSGRPGPKPLRSAHFPWGFPWLTGSRHHSCELGNYFVKTSWLLIQRAQGAGIPHFMEHPEDLGATSAGHRPGSIWQFPEQRQLLKETQASTWAVYQCHFGADSPKPTRFMSNLARAKMEKNQG